MTQPNFVLGRRILVRGVTGSGKTTLARQLADALGLPLIELDALHWTLPDWQEPPVEDFRAGIATALAAAPEGWVCDGNYTRQVADLILDDVDTLIWLDLPWRVSFWRLLKRTIPRGWRRELLWGTCRESLRQSFASRDSILWWSITHHRVSRRQTQQLVAGLERARAYRLRSAREVQALLDAAATIGAS